MSPGHRPLVSCSGTAKSDRTAGSGYHRTGARPLTPGVQAITGAEAAVAAAFLAAAAGADEAHSRGGAASASRNTAAMPGVRP